MGLDSHSDVYSEELVAGGDEVCVFIVVTRPGLNSVSITLMSTPKLRVRPYLGAGSLKMHLVK